MKPTLEKILPILKDLKPYLYERWGVIELAIFGSVAREEATPESDVDILFDYEYPIGLELVSLAEFLESQLNCKVDLLSKKAIRAKVWDFIQSEIFYV